MKRYFRKVIYKYLDKVYLHFRQKDKIILEAKKENLINKIQSFGYGSVFNGTNNYVSRPEKLIIGNNVHIGNNAFLKTDGGLIIKDNTHISRNLTVYTVNHNYNGTALPYDNTTDYKPVTIMENVWIGMNVSITPGVTIGEGAIIGIGTVVNRDVLPYEIIGSTKAVSLKERNIEHYLSLKNQNKFGGVNGLLLDEALLKKFKSTYKDNSEKPIVFILGTGRCGTVSIIDLLNQHPDCKGMHEEIKQLIRLSTDIAYDNDRDTYYQELNNIFETKIWNGAENQLIVHSDQRFWNLIDWFSEYFPNAKFIHLIREPLSCIKSMVLRGWYEKDEYPNVQIHDWAKYRLQGDLVGIFSAEEWANLSNIQKCTWYYFFINKSIKESLSKLDDEKGMTIQLEDLSQKTEELLSFLDLSIQELNVPISNQIRKRDLKNTQKADNINIEKSILNEIDKYR